MVVIVCDEKTLSRTDNSCIAYVVFWYDCFCTPITYTSFGYENGGVALQFATRTAVSEVYDKRELKWWTLYLIDSVCDVTHVTSH